MWPPSPLCSDGMVHSVSLSAPVSPRAECRTPGASLPLASPLLLRVDAASYNHLWQDVDLAVAILQPAARGAATGTAFDVSAAQRDALCMGRVSRLPRCPIVGPRSPMPPMGCSPARQRRAPLAPPSSCVLGPSFAGPLRRATPRCSALSRHDVCFFTPWPRSWHPMFFFRPSAVEAAAVVRVPSVASAPLFAIRSRLPAPFSLQPIMSIRSTPPQDSPSPALDTSQDGAIRRRLFPMFLMDIAQSDDTDRLLRELDILKDNALEAADEAIRAPDPVLADLCNALRWTDAQGSLQAITAVTGRGR